MTALAEQEGRRQFGAVPTFEHAVAGVILANTGVLVAGLVVDGHELAFEVAHTSFVGFFGIELALRLRAGGWRFLRRPLNMFDTAVIAMSVLPVLGVDASLLRLARLARLVHLVRHISHLRLIRVVRVDAMLVAGVALALAAVFMGTAVLSLNPWI
ncbi:MAG: voltage-gated sodium channel [Mycobacterium sp.]|nr:voltage-gated sodium channel [Mycobacterium sp.]